MPVQSTRHTLTRLAPVAALALLSACATQQRYSAQQESTQYRSHAGHSYTPPGPSSDPWGPYISEASAKFDVPERWVREVMRQESGGRLYGRGGDLVTSGAGAMGLMQVMPATYDEIRARYPELGTDPYDPHNNILAGTAYIREMYDIYGSPGFLAAYNAGPGRLDDYLTRNRGLPEETRRYVAAIGPRLAGAEPRNPSPGQQFAMNATPFSIPEGPRYASNTRYSAPATGPYIQLGTPAPIEPVAPAAPIQLAAAQPIVLAPPAPIEAGGPRSTTSPSGEPYIVLSPQPIEAPAEIPAYTPTYAPSYAAAPSLQPQAPLPSPPAPAYAALPRMQAPLGQFAQLPEPPPYQAPPRTQQQLAAAALVPGTPRGGFPFISSAHAEPIGIRHAGFAPGNWAVQVGAYANEGLASSAALTARDQARDSLGGARSSVTPVRQPHGILYRARLTGLSRDSAAQACEHLARTRTNCIIISPDAQS